MKNKSFRIALLAVSFMLLPLVPAKAKRIALVIGIDRYDNMAAVNQLQKAVSDARAMKMVFRGLGFDVVEIENASRPTFNVAWQNFLDRIEKKDVIAFYFAGHGVELDGQNFLLPSDVPKLRLREKALLRRQSISFNELLADLRRRKPRLSIIILDACRNNPFADNRGRAVGTSRGIGRVEPPEGTFVMYSAGAGQSALDRLGDGDKDPNSVYTRTLLPLLKTSGLSLTDMARLVKVKVRDLAKSVYHIQTPAYYDEVIGPSFCLKGPCGSQSVLPAPAPKIEHKVEDRFQDCKSCPQMVVVPKGSFMMGSKSNDPKSAKSEQPRHKVNISNPVAISKYEVTFSQWDACVADGGCNGYRPKDEGWGRGKRPVIHVSWHDARAYAAWLSRKTGQKYRLPSEAEWEYAARAGSSTRYFFGDRKMRLCEFANGADKSATNIKDRNQTCNDGFGNSTATVGSYKPNAFGLHDMAGNVWEWVADCWRADYRGEPTHGSARAGMCAKHVIRGGSWAVIPRGLRPAFRAGVKAGYRDDDAGFRVVREVE